MPNGGSDCCGTCWFNEINNGEAGYKAIKENPKSLLSSYCTIRNEKILEPMYTYCVNHPHHNPKKLNIPIGPITISESRNIWKKSLDTKEIRDFLVDYLASIKEEKTITEYPYGHSMEDAIIMHIRDLEERRAIPELERIANFKEQPKKDSNNPFIRDKNATIGLAIDTLTKLKGDEMIPFLEKKIKSENDNIRGYCVLSLDYCSTNRAIELLKRSLNDTNERISQTAKEILEKKENLPK